MESCSKLLVILMLLSGAGTLFGEDADDLSVLNCDEPACDKIAESVDYQYDKPVKSFTLKTDHFSIEVPDKPIEKIVTSKEDLIILYQDNHVLYFAENKGPPIENLNPDFVYRYPEIVFLKTNKDSEPEDHNEKFFWKIALGAKPLYFNEATKVTYVENGDLTYYLSNTSELGFSARAMVSNSKYKNLFLVIEAKEVDFNTFKQVVSSIN